MGLDVVALSRLRFALTIMFLVADLIRARQLS